MCSNTTYAKNSLERIDARSNGHVSFILTSCCIFNKHSMQFFVLFQFLYRIGEREELFPNSSAPYIRNEINVSGKFITTSEKVMESHLQFNDHHQQRHCPPSSYCYKLSKQVSRIGNVVNWSPKNSFMVRVINYVLHETSIVYTTQEMLS